MLLHYNNSTVEKIRLQQSKFGISKCKVPSKITIAQKLYEKKYIK